MQCLWVLDVSCKRALWSRRFTTVLGKKRAGRVFPDEDEFVGIFGSALKLHREAADSMVPVLTSKECHVLHKDERIVFVECGCGGWLVAWIGLQEQEEESDHLAHVDKCGHGGLLSTPQVAVVLETLSQLAVFLEAQMQQAALGPGFWAAVNVALSMSMPFGCLVRPFHVGEALAVSGAASSSSFADGGNTLLVGGGQSNGSVEMGSSARVAAWRVADAGAAVPKKSKIVLCIEEVIESHQYDRAGGSQDSARLRGRVTLLSDYAAPQMEVSMKVALSSPAVGDRLSADSCVTVFTSTANQKLRTVHLTAIPSLRFLHTLLRYEAAPPSVMPWRAFYQMKPGPGAREAKVLIQLKLSESVPNQFDGCCVVIPFQDSGGNVESFEVSPTEGVVRRGPNDASTLVWDLGNSIVGNTLAGRRLECALPMTVRFVDDSISANSRWACFAELVFRLVGGTSLCGVSINTDEVVVFPKPVHPPLVTVSTVISSGVYRIFNSLA